VSTTYFPDGHLTYMRSVGLVAIVPSVTWRNIAFSLRSEAAVMTLAFLKVLPSAVFCCPAFRLSLFGECTKRKEFSSMILFKTSAEMSTLTDSLRASRRYSGVGCSRLAAHELHVRALPKGFLHLAQIIVIVCVCVCVYVGGGGESGEERVLEGNNF